MSFVASSAWADPEEAMNKAGCMACHTKDKNLVGPSFKEIAAKRDAYVKVETEKQGLKGEDAFDTAVRDSLTKQAEGKGYTFK